MSNTTFYVANYFTHVDTQCEIFRESIDAKWNCKSLNLFVVFVELFNRTTI